MRAVNRSKRRAGIATLPTIKHKDAKQVEIEEQEIRTTVGRSCASRGGRKKVRLFFGRDSFRPSGTTLWHRLSSGCMVFRGCRRGRRQHRLDRLCYAGQPVLKING